MQDKHGVVQFTSSKIEDLMFRTTLDLKSMQGDIIVNLSIADADDFVDVLEFLKLTFNSGLSVSPFLKILESGDVIGDLTIPEGKVGIATMCSMTIDGVLLKSGIMTNPKFGGVVQIRNGLPVRFTDVLTYASTTIDPLEVLMSQDITSVTRMLQTGSGKILANLREVHLAKRDEINSVLSGMMDIGINGILEVGDPNSRVLDVPVERDHLGVVVIGGTNPMAIMKEQGINIRTNAMSTLMDINSMNKIEDYF
ncbi:DUF128 domain-containing protein [Methanohalophilus mahii]|uniref:NrpR regulatory domain-containing protein n=1 Tax=Methanohalophilus mahii (strain ATCC 35705 / DSM 5219 / SLP) TaxID=547558 RepID=D5E812_METMS|nr:DUF128 domain-containing protein [Methanohalophilus mahii]ADE37300.1 Protein of unknown function DUF128 [Methanohalophilus mahii DSM 5219]